MGKTIQFPNSSPDVQTMMLDGKPEIMLSARGVLLFYLSSWKVVNGKIKYTNFGQKKDTNPRHRRGQISPQSIPLKQTGGHLVKWNKQSQMEAEKNEGVYSVQ